MNNEETALGELRRFVHDHARIQRKRAAEGGVYVSVRKILDAIFEAENVDIAFADESEVFFTTLDEGNGVGLHIGNPGDFDWFKETAEDKLRFQVTIFLPEVVLRNSESKQHQIKDLFVRFYLSADGLLLKDNGDRYLFGTRSSFTEEEVVAEYGHSHLPKMQFKQLQHFRSFCTGSGDINTIMERMSESFDQNLFTQFCHCLKVYLSWESLEGVPYVKIKSVIGADQGSRNTEFPAVDVDEVFGFWIRKLNELNEDQLRPLFHVSIEDGKFELSLSKAGQSFLISHMAQDPSLKHPRYFAIKLSNGRLIPLSDQTTNPSDIPVGQRVLNFRHKEIKLQLLNSNSTLDATATFLSPRITDGFRRIFTDKFNASFVRENALIPQCPSLNTGLLSRQD